MRYKFLTAFFCSFLLFSHTGFSYQEGENAYNAGMRAYKKQEYQNAIYAFENSIAYDPTLYKSYCLLGLSYILNDEPKKGVDAYLNAIQKFPTEWNAYILLAEFYEAQNNYSEALSYYLQAENILPKNEVKKYQSKINTLKEKQKAEWAVSESEKETILSNVFTPLDQNIWRVALVEKKESAIHIVYGLKSENYRSGKWSKILDLSCTYTSKQDAQNFSKINEWLAVNYRKDNADMDTIEKTERSRLYEVNLHDKKLEVLGYIFPVSKGFCIAQFNYKTLSSSEKETWKENIKKINVRNF